jgi:hypothetical protein
VLVASRASEWVETMPPPCPACASGVTSRESEWVETSIRLMCIRVGYVASRVSEWVETQVGMAAPPTPESSISRQRVG